MSKNINISISGINTNKMNTLENKYNQNIKITNTDNNTINLNISDSSYSDLILLKIEDFLNDLENQKVYKLTSSYVFDENNSLIIGPSGKKELTSKEVMFLKILLLNNRIVTYSQMINLLWKNRNDVSSNAVRLFVKNIKKKLPSNILKNFQDIGYKLVL